MAELYVFGYGYNEQFPNPQQTGSHGSEHLPVRILSTPTCCLRAESIEIVWASWCDLIIRLNHTSHHYYGTSLLPSQIHAITSLTTPATFFGHRETSGVHGFILPTSSLLTTLHTPQEIAQGAPPLSTTSLAPSPWTLLTIHFTANDTLFATLAPRTTTTCTPSTPTSTIIQAPSLHHLSSLLLSPAASLSLPRELTHSTIPPSQTTSNDTTLTYTSPTGTLHTLTTDPRFPRAAGRPVSPLTEDADAHLASRVPFLEEIRIAKIAAGGLYTAAVAEDGELYVWGQAVAGAPGELGCLQEGEGAEDGDEYVRTVEVGGGGGARVVDVGVGVGHVVVAVRRGGKEEVWAAGDNRYGALGLGEEMAGREFVGDFEAVRALEGKRVKQMVCAGMSSYVLVESGRKDGSEE